MKRSLALGFVTYNPEGNFVSRVQLAVESGFDVYIFDNTPEKRSLGALIDCPGKVKYVTCGKNYGLGLGIQSVCAQAYYEQHEALVFFDQDSIFDQSTLLFIERFYVEHPELKGSHTVIVFNANKVAEEQANCFREVQLAINSGSLFFLNNLKTLGWHNERYFVDGVDYELCLRSSLGGFKIAEYSCTPGFDHASEQPDREYRVFGKTYAMRAYAPSRILDVTISSFRLVLAALIGRKIAFAYRIMCHWVVFMAMQLLVRTLSPVDRV